MSRDYLLFLEDMQTSCEKILWDILQKQIRPILDQINKILADEAFGD